ncbi:dipeptide/oligopeptide/nickel ABC transporter permease/ATP-binding protein [Herbiconiux ginsengi]|uniref:Peptide/nickel transport system permease protein n=1 Tax=Herbiconiux ginsengi TaxID=381665 RepID=A0A1H3TH94_9MICO|nr:dipeptide/oligopeptide/nickel ABC transporter permease/ATP-binding protein [Herbiconiux ginsengi]SDZ49238.1 peptide/nickel transport system permease protein [Herbiconiux ginsengi]
MSVLIPDSVENIRRPNVFRRLLGNPMAVGSMVLIAAVIVLGLLAPVLSPHSPNFSSLDAVNAPVGTPGYLLGGDSSGRDIFARLLASVNTAMLSAITGVAVALLIGIPFGLISGYAKPRTDSVFSWVFNLLMTFPALVLLIVAFPITGGSYVVMMAIFGFLFSPSIFRLVRNLVVAVKRELYIDAARVSGLSTARILRRHILPAVRGPIVITASFLAGVAIAVQAGLAFLGLGTNDVPSFGSMTADAFANLYVYPIQFLWPTIMLAILSGGFVLIGNGLRDALEDSSLAPTKALRPSNPEARHATARAPHGPAQTSEGPSPLLRIRNLRVSYPTTGGQMKQVVNGISLDLNAGGVLGLIGESGSGKTQTAFAVLGLLTQEARVEADEFTLDGHDLLSGDAGDLKRLRTSLLAYVPQEPMSNLAPSFTVGAQLVEGIRATKGGTKREARQLALDLLRRVGIVDPARTYRSYPHEISGGMAQRVLIAGAIAAGPRLLIADEPTTALDVTVQAEILDLLRNLQTDLSMSVLLVTHNFGVVADLCDEVAVMRSGEIVEAGSYRNLYRHAEHVYTKQLIGAILDEDTYRTDPVATSAYPDHSEGSVGR